MANFSADIPTGAPVIAGATNIAFSAVVSPPIVDALPPTITLVSPSPGTKIARNTPFVVDVTDNFGSPFVAIWVRCAGTRVYEVAWDGSGWSELYSIGSSLVGNRYTLRREGGWPGAPTITIRAFDGNMV